MSVGVARLNSEILPSSITGTLVEVHRSNVYTIVTLRGAADATALDQSTCDRRPNSSSISAGACCSLPALPDHDRGQRVNTGQRGSGLAAYRVTSPPSSSLLCPVAVSELGERAMRTATVTTTAKFSPLVECWQRAVHGERMTNYVRGCL